MLQKEGNTTDINSMLWYTIMRNSIQSRMLDGLTSRVGRAKYARGIKAVTELYFAFRSDKQPSLKELPIQDADYAMWQHESMQGLLYARKLTLRKGTLSNALIRVRENFFALGGHSLLFTQIVIGIGERLGKSISLRALFNNSTVERFAAHVSEPAAHVEELAAQTVMNPIALPKIKPGLKGNRVCVS